MKSKSSEIPSNIYPSLSYDDAASAIEWLCRVFGFTKQFVVPGLDGIIVHSELSLGSGVIMVSTTKPDEGRVSPRRLSGVNQSLCILIDDPDTHFAHAKSSGAEIIDDLKDSEFGFRGYMTKDLEGHLWYFGTYRPGEHWDSNLEKS